MGTGNRTAIVIGSPARPIYGVREADPEVALMDAVRSLKEAAMAYDPTIKGLWVGREDIGGGDFRLSHIVFDRSGIALDASRNLKAGEATK